MTQDLLKVIEDETFIVVLSLVFLSFEFVSDFGIRVSNFINKLCPGLKQIQNLIKKYPQGL